MVVFRPPVMQRRMPIMAGLAALINYSPALLLINGQWVQTEFPSEQQINAASLYFPGGYEHDVDDATAVLLMAAGYSINAPIKTRAPAEAGTAIVGVSPTYSTDTPNASSFVGTAVVGVSRAQ